MSPLTLKKRRLMLTLCAVVFAVAAPVFLLYSTGYRWNALVGFYKTGGLYIASPISGTEIFVDNKKEIETGFFNSGLFLQDLAPNEYFVMAAKENFWPWAKRLTVKEQMVTEARAILVPRNPKNEIIFQGKDISAIKDKNILEVVKKLKLLVGENSTSTPIFTADNKQKLWWDESKQKLFSEWLGDNESIPYYFCAEQSLCQKIITVMNSLYPIRSADFYPGRNDVAIIAIQNGIYVIELDNRGGRMLLPVYKGKNPVFMANKNEKAVYIFDRDNNLFIKTYLE